MRIQPSNTELNPDHSTLPPDLSPRSSCLHCSNAPFVPRLLNKKQVLQRTGISAKTTFDDMVRRGEFPRATAYMNRKPFWTPEVVDAWIADLIAKTAESREDA